MERERQAERQAVRPLVTPERLRRFFAPRSIALVGASDTSGWAQYIMLSSQVAGFGGPLIPVHPGHTEAFGRLTVPSLRHLEAPVDLAYVLAPQHAVEDVLDDAAAAGVRNAVVLASGYGEVGEDGRDLQERLVTRAAKHDITLLGPNCLGFLNAHARCAPFGLPIPPPLTAGPVGMVLQSGALATAVLAFARAHIIGVSLLTSVGNEAMITTTDVIEYLTGDPATKVIALFLEEISRPADFARAAQRAAAAGKPIVAIKTGSSPGGQAAALAHTGSVAGDDEVVSAELRRLGIIRVKSLEELLTTAALLGYNRHPRGGRMGVLSASGGACGVIADRAAEEGLQIPEFAPRTTDAIRSVLPSFASARNPLDVTGYVLANRRTSALTAIDHALDAAVDDPGLDFVLFSGITLPEARPLDDVLAAMLEERMDWIARRIGDAPIPVIPVGTVCVNVNGYAREHLVRCGINLLPGLELAIPALRNALWWAANRERVATGVTRAAIPEAGKTYPPGPWSELAARELLAASGVPLIPAERARSAAEAVSAAQRLGMPVAVKIVSSDITHKSDIGGVALGLGSAAEVSAGYERVVAAAGAVPGARVDGVLVSPMRTGGVELLAGVTMDPTFGPVLTVGLGGLWVEILRDTSLRVLPVELSEVRRMLTELRGAPLLRGARGTRPVNLDRLAEAISAIADAALSLGGSLRALEVNPLWVSGDQVEALDALVVTGPAGSSAGHSPGHSAGHSAGHSPGNFVT
jgi:acetate---CoA ligase (ADP-forming)